MSEPAISLRGVGKKFVLGASAQHDTLRDQIASLARKLTGKKGPEAAAKDFWAIRDISFDVGEGEVLGIVGHNGAGKSTLLKVLSQISEPSEGELRIRGRIASLLEVGTGFHPELSGRENIFLNGAILGMSRSEIRAKFDEIIAFAEVEKFLDTPVKRYSSGMYVRLAFAVAAHLEPEILVVDEVLAVGDGAFQRKCLGKMGDASRSGRTILFVSHNLSAVRTLCGRGVLLNRGRMEFSGTADEVVRRYLTSSRAACSDREWSAPETDHAPGEVKLLRARLTPTNDSGVLDVHAAFDLEFEFWNGRPDAELNASLVLYTDDDVPAFNTSSPRKVLPQGIHKATCRIPGDLLNDNSYRVRLLLVERARPHEDHHHLFTFDVADGEGARMWYGKWIGSVRPKLDWTFSSTT
jgi:lipopolysaccharide transport system ATP-binding protein